MSMPSRNVRLGLATALGLAALMALAFVVVADTPAPSAPPAPAPDGRGLTLGKLTARSVGQMAWGPPGILFVADPEGSAVFALDVGIGSVAPSEIGYRRLEDLDAKAAALLGTTPRELFFKDLATHPTTHTIYLTVMRGQGEAARPAILTVSPAGELAELALDSIAHARLELANPPAPDAKLYHLSSRSLTITDLEFIDGELLIAGLSNEEFASKLRRSPFPFTGEVGTVGLEIFHGAHGEWETFAPIFSMTRFDVDGKPHLLAGYLCTPLVTLPLDAVRSEKRLRGKTIAELGYGNVPKRILPYEHEGKRWLLVLNDRRGGMRLKAEDVEAAFRREPITQTVEREAGIGYQTSALGHALQIADFDAERIALLVRSPDNGALVLGLAPKGFL